MNLENSNTISINSITLKDASIATNCYTMSERVVLRLVEGLDRGGHCLYCNNYYTSPQSTSLYCVVVEECSI